MSEAKTSADIVERLQRIGARLFRNNVGAYADPRRKGKWVRYGVGGNGGSDLIGFVPVEITPDMVGKTVAIFTAVEVKRDESALRKWMRQSDERSTKQAHFINGVNAAGGIACCASSPDGADSAIQVRLLSFRKTQ